MILVSSVLFVTVVSANLLITTLDKSLSFIDNYYSRFNIDGAIGVTIAEGK